MSENIKYVFWKETITRRKTGTSWWSVWIWHIIVCQDVLVEEESFSCWGWRGWSCTLRSSWDGLCSWIFFIWADFIYYFFRNRFVCSNLHYFSFFSFINQSGWNHISNWTQSLDELIHVNSIEIKPNLWITDILTCENVSYKEVKLVTDKETIEKLGKKGKCDGWRIFHDTRAAVILYWNVVTLNKPRYVGTVILGISKIVPYRHWYLLLLDTYQQRYL